MKSANEKWYICIYIIAPMLLLVMAQNELSSQEKLKCASDLINWCEETKNEGNNHGISTISFSDTSDGQYSQITCTQSYGSTTCTKNGNFLFLCSQDGKLFYKGTLIKNNSTEGIDNEICYAWKIPNKLYQRVRISVSNVKHNMQHLRSDLSAQFKKQQKHLNQEMSKLNQRLNSMTRKLTRPCFPFCRD